ncbi:MerR family transcriptional regulator [Streptomyces rubiginosohelvolus]|uniref:MerR family transcriptional regulator n=1 Tax=Streptomyces rubiginosohelvolus TaxID=67362 RepID=UPI0035D59474
MSSSPARPVPTELAALAAGVGQATIRKWASRGKITRYGTPGRAIYDLDELLEIVASKADAAAQEPQEPQEPQDSADPAGPACLD